MTLAQQDIFIAWLDQKLSDKGWTDYQLAKNANISHSVISKARSGTLPKWEACEKIAGALGVPVELAFRKAGLLKQRDDIDETLEEANMLLAELPELFQEEALAIIKSMHERHAKYEATPNPKETLGNANA